VFGDWSASIDAADGQLFVASPPSGSDALWSIQRLSLAGREAGELGEYLLGFGEDADGELYVLTSASAGPTGSTGTVYRLAPGARATTAQSERLF
jgi:hypothetical protein